MKENIEDTAGIPEEEPGPVAEPENAGSDEEQDQEQYEGTPEELTALPAGAGPARFDRKKVMLVICAGFSLVVVFGIIFSSSKDKNKKDEENRTSSASAASSDFLQSELRQTYLRQQREQEEAARLAAAGQEGIPQETEINDEQGLPKVETVLLNEKPKTPSQAPQTQTVSSKTPPPPRDDKESEDKESFGSAPPPDLAARFSPMVPAVEGSLFGTSSQRQQEHQPYSQNIQNAGQQAYSDYISAAQSARQQASPSAPANPADKSSFYNSSSTSSGILSGNFLQADILWIGTIIPAVLETAINTDLPGNVIARVSQNIYDSHTGKKLLIPQGSILVAKYNNSISYAQKRIQIVWDLLIRPDGYQIELEGMNGVDPKGMAGLKAKYSENWFEYVKAAGIISMFTVTTSKATEQAAKYSASETASAVAQANAQFAQQMGGSIINRAMDIQPTLTVPSGEKIIVMLNKNVYFPPLPSYPVVQKYNLDR